MIHWNIALRLIRLLEKNNFIQVSQNGSHVKIRNIENGKQVIDNNTLTALTLLIAESNPKEKEVIIDLVMNFLNNE